MQRPQIKRFLYTLVPFTVLGAAFKVMVLVEGLTEIRPVNAIPIVAGLLCGPVGALGCALGNLIADFFGSLSYASLLGMLINFLAAYIPWRLWYLFRRELPNVHTWKNIFIFAWLSLISAQTAAWLLSFGMEIFFHTWIKNLYIYVFYNNFAFSLGLGLPVFIVLTSDSVKILPEKPPKKAVHSKVQLKTAKAAAVAYTAVMTEILTGVFCGYHSGNSIAMILSSILGLALLIFLCRTPVQPQTE